jgi:hypothetical protein
MDIDDNLRLIFRREEMSFLCSLVYIKTLSIRYIIFGLGGP